MSKYGQLDRLDYLTNLRMAHRDCRAGLDQVGYDYASLSEKTCNELARQALSCEDAPTLTKYQVRLLASFVRTAAITRELILRSDLIEAATLGRKQLELVARLRELESASSLDLKSRGKTPQLRELKSQVKALYGDMSDTAHSSEELLFLLGESDDRPRRSLLMYPEFTKNTEVTFHQWWHVIWEFFWWALDFKVEAVPTYQPAADHAKLWALFNDFQNLPTSRHPPQPRR